MMLEDILVPFLTIGLAELGDKTQLAVLSLASQTKKHFELLFGVLLAFAVADGLAIIFGSFLTNIVPAEYIKIGAGIIFVIFGIIILLNRKDSGRKFELKSPFVTGFFLILLSEMGDKTQIASGLFAAELNPFFVFIGVMIALALLSIMAIYIGKYAVKKINRKIITVAAGILFILIGLITLLGIF